MTELQTAVNEGQKTEAKMSIQKAVMHQQELAVQEMQQTIMAGGSFRTALDQC